MVIFGNESILERQKMSKDYEEDENKINEEKK